MEDKRPITRAMAANKDKVPGVAKGSKAIRKKEKGIAKVFKICAMAKQNLGKNTKISGKISSLLSNFIN